MPFLKRFLPKLRLEPVAANPLAFDLALGVLRGYSLITRDVNRETDISRLSIHRIMQEVLRSEMDEETQRLWAERAIRAVYQVLPFVDWSVMLPHAQTCLHHLDRWQMSFEEAVQLRHYVESKLNIQT